MNDEAQKIVVSQFPVTGILGVVFVTLKLLGYINWSWWWVTAPFWGPLALVLAIILIVMIFMGIGYGVLALLGK